MIERGSKKAKEVSREDSAPVTTHPASSTPTKPTYFIKAKDFTVLAGYVASSEKPIVQAPSTLIKVLDRATAPRKEHYSYRNHGRERRSAEATESDNTHAHFPGALERTRKILKPRMHPKMIDTQLTKTASEKVSTQNTKFNKDDKLCHTFKTLELLEPS